MAGRLIAQLIVAGGQIFARAFAQAYRQAAANAAKGGGPAAAASGAAKQTKAASATRGMMSVDEAQKVLNIDTGTDWADVLKRYEHMFKANDKKNGGSFYLQSKIYRAKERLETERAEELAKMAPAKDAEGTETADSAAADSHTNTEGQTETNSDTKSDSKSN